MVTEDEQPEVTDEDFAELTRQAHELGLHYSGDNPLELQAHIAMATAERGVEHPVPCYGVSYDPSNRPCRVCKLRNPCADLDSSPRVEVADVRHLADVPCEACRRGELSVELLHTETRELRDYGCTSAGCQNTIGIQCGWSETIKPAEIVLGEPDPEEGSADPSETAGAESPAETPDDGVASSNGESASVAPPSGGKKKKPKLRVVKGGQTAKKTTKKKAAKRKKVTVKKAPKKAPKKVAKKVTKKVTVKKKARVRKAGSLVFNWGGKKYDSLTAIAEAITGGRNWSGPKFFRVKSAEIRAGDTLERAWEGDEHTVEVTKS